MLQDKLKTLRKENHLTQEQLADTLGVSRQAVTKWEMGAGIPDIENLEALSKLFHVSIEELLSKEEEKEEKPEPFSSRTLLDIPQGHTLEFAFCPLKELEVCFSKGKQVGVELHSDAANPKELAKLFIDNYPSTELTLRPAKRGAAAKEELSNHLSATIYIPSEGIDHVEIEGKAKALRLHDFEKAIHLEFAGKAEDVTILNAKGHVELDCQADATFLYDGSLDLLEINQIRRKSVLKLISPEAVELSAEGGLEKLEYINCRTAEHSEHKVELNGWKNVLTIEKA